MATLVSLRIVCARASVSAVAAQQRGGAALSAAAFSRTRRSAAEAAHASQIAKSMMSRCMTPSTMGRGVHETVGPQHATGTAANGHQIFGAGALTTALCFSMFAERAVRCADETEDLQ
eukprot:TRINITY_DN14417_c0_g1_i1.p1 TRINITY_DN14417_c0_g1~~TRINITY_DN14417_c0_g1_i1.p1  ORF type:complete len:118 (+),score=10.80 TRINITY_DN14417_c0_g1_i1:99-452(+)